MQAQQKRAIPNFQLISEGLPSKQEGKGENKGRLEPDNPAGGGKQTYDVFKRASCSPKTGQSLDKKRK